MVFDFHSLNVISYDYKIIIGDQSIFFFFLSDCNNISRKMVYRLHYNNNNNHNKTSYCSIIIGSKEH